MCIRDSLETGIQQMDTVEDGLQLGRLVHHMHRRGDLAAICLLYTSDAADERSSVDLGGRRIIKKKKKLYLEAPRDTYSEKYTRER